MLRGYRFLILAAVVGLAFISFGLGSLFTALNYAQEQRYQSYLYATDKPQEINPALTGQPNAKPFEYRTPCYEPKGRDESDLCAQWRAAQAGEDSALWAKWGFWIGVIGSSLLLWQIILTRKAVKDTGEATKAMREANDIAKESQRPWISIFIKPRFVKMSETSFRVEADVLAENVGQTPAFDYYLFVRAFFEESANGVRIINNWFDDVSLEVEPNRKTLVPGATDRWPYHYVIRVDELPDTAPVIIIAVCVIYKTAKTVKRWERIDQAAYIIRRDSDGFNAAFPQNEIMEHEEGLETYPFTSAPLSAYWTDENEDDK